MSTHEDIIPPVASDFYDLAANRPAAVVAVPAEHVLLHCNIIHETEKAIYLRPLGHIRDEWFPLSQISYIYRANGYNYTTTTFADIIHVKEWIVKKKEITPRKLT